MSPEHHRPGVGVLQGDVFLGQQHAVNPARHRIALRLHQLFRLEATKDILVVNVPNTAPVLPRAGLQAVVAGQRVAEDAEVGRTLHVVVAAEDVGAAASRAHVAKGQLHYAVRTCVVVARRVLGAAHAPDNGARTVIGQRPGDAPHLRAGNARYTLGLGWVPLLNFRSDLIHAVDALLDELLVFPTVLKHVPENAPDQRHVGARTEPHVFIGVGRRACEPRIADDQGGVVLLLGLEDVLHGHRVSFRRGGADHEDGPRVMHVGH